MRNSSPPPHTMHSSTVHPKKSTVSESMSYSMPSSPSSSLDDFEYDSEAPAKEVKAGYEPIKLISPIIHSPAPESPILLPDVRSDVVTKDDVASLRQLIQHEFDQLKLHKSTLPPVQIPKEAFTDALRADMAVQLAKISALEEENRQLRAEKQALRVALDRAENQPGLQAELNAANQELKSVYVERQGLWDERAALWKERGELWEERADLWRERGSLWDERADLWVVRDGLMEKVASLEAKQSE
ncbi:hypothetical protein ACGC1H_003393 [Rhizoctonia solani]